MDILSIYAPAHWDPYDSYGLIACELARRLTRKGIYINALGHGYREHSNQDEELKAITSKPIKASLGGIFLGYPTSYEDHGPIANLGKKIAITMFESSKVPDGWVDALNKCDAIIVPSTFCHSTFIRCGVAKPVYVIPLGIGDEYLPVKRDLNKPFTFLTFADRGRRKGGLDCLYAFVEEFEDTEDVQLIIKRKDKKNEDTPKVNFTNKNIHTIYKDMTPEELYDLYADCHCLVNPNKGEGFGLIPREFSATGGISLATDWGGTADLVGFWGIPLEAKLEKADWRGHRNLAGKDLGQWATVPRNILRKSMRWVYDHKHVCLKEAQKNADWVREMYSWDLFADVVYTVWDKLNNGDIRTSGETEAGRRVLQGQ